MKINILRFSCKTCKNVSKVHVLKEKQWKICQKNMHQLLLNFKPVLVILHSEGLTDQESQNEVFGLKINIVHYIKVTVNLLKKWLNTGILPLVFL